MDAETERHLITWRAEIAAELSSAAADLAQAKLRLAEAETAQKAERARIAALRETTGKWGSGRSLASALTWRIEQALKPRVSIQPYASQAEAAERRVTDCQDALDQIDAILHPPLRLPAPVATAPATTSADIFEPIEFRQTSRPAKVA